MKKILIFGSLPSGYGGMEKVFRQFSTLFNDTDGHFITKFFMYELNVDDNNIEWTKDLDVTIYKPSSNFRFIQKRQAIKQFLKFVAEYEPNVILVSDPLSIFLARNAIQKSKKSIPIYSWMHFSVKEYRQKYQQYIKLADKHLVLCDEMKKQLIELDLAKENNSFVIYNPITPKEESIPKPVDGSYQFLYVGRVQYGGQKNMQELFNALGLFPHPFTLNILGDGEDEDKIKLQNLAQELKISDSIVWHGWQKDPWGYVYTEIKNVTALVLTLTYEGFALVLAEAISYGIFCISSDCEVGPNEIINEKNGLLYSMGDINTLNNYLAKSTTQSDDPLKIKNSIEYLYNKNFIQKINSVLR